MRNTLFLFLSVFFLSFGSFGVSGLAHAEPTSIEAPELTKVVIAADAGNDTDTDTDALKSDSDTDSDVPLLLNDDDAISMSISLIEAIQDQKWSMAVGLLLSLLVYGFNRFAMKEKIGPKLISVASLLVAVAGSIGTGLIAGTPVLEAITAGVIAGFVAMGGWESIMNQKKSAPEEATTE